MSAGGSIEKCEPNMTPLRDLVLQWIMFFMLCANFVMEQVDESVRLPEAIAAKSLDRATKDYIILNVMVNPENGRILTTVGPAEVLDGPVQITNYMKNQYELDQARAKPAEWEAGKGRSLVILRADIGNSDPSKGPVRPGCNFGHVHDVMTAVQKAGYNDVQLRTIQASAPGA